MNTWNDLSLSEKSEMMRVAIENGITTLPEIKEAYNQFALGGFEDNKPKFQKSSEAYYDPDSDTVFAPDSTGEYYYHELFHARPDNAYLQKIAPLYSDLNDEKITQMGVDLPFVKRFEGDPGHFYSPEEVGARRAAASYMLKQAGVKSIDDTFLNEARKDELKYGNNFRDLLHMYNNENLLQLDLLGNQFAEEGNIYSGKDEPTQKMQKRSVTTTPNIHKWGTNEYGFPTTTINEDFKDITKNAVVALSPEKPPVDAPYRGTPVKDKLTHNSYIGGNKEEARQTYWEEAPVMKAATDSIAGRYGITGELLRNRLDKEGFTDNAIKDYNAINTDNYYGFGEIYPDKDTVRHKMLGYDYLDTYWGPRDGIGSFGLDDAATYIYSGLANLINEGWYGTTFINEKGRKTNPVAGLSVKDNMGIMASLLKGFRDQAAKDYPNATSEELDKYANIYYNRGIEGARSYINSGKGSARYTMALGGSIKPRHSFGLGCNLFSGEEDHSSQMHQGYVYDVLPKMLKEAGLNVRVTSGYRRPGQAGKAGSRSWHTHHGAVDIVPQGKTTFEDIENALYNNPVISRYMIDNGFGLIDESGRTAESRTTMKKTGATGAHFHIGKDSKAVSAYNNKMSSIWDSNMSQLETAINQSTLPAFMPSNPQAFFTPLESYQRPIVVEEPLVQAAMENPYSPEQLEREERRRGLNNLSFLLGMTSPQGSDNSFASAIGMLAGS